MYENFLWSGCSFSWGSGFYDFTENNTATWRHPYFPEYFGYGEFGKKLNSKELQLSILPHTFPNLLGKKLNVDNIQNLSLPGKGTSIHIRRLMSYIETYKDKIDLSKTFVGFQITSLSRVDIINALSILDDNQNWYFDFIFNDKDFQFGNGLSFYKNHFDFDFYVIKHLQEILSFKKYLDSYNIDNFFMGLHEDFKKNLIINKNNRVFKEVNGENSHPIQVSFPDVNNVLNSINYYELKNRVETLQSIGVNDSHYSIKGHMQVSDELYYEILKRKNFND